VQLAAEENHAKRATTLKPSDDTLCAAATASRRLGGTVLHNEQLVVGPLHPHGVLATEERFQEVSECRQNGCKLSASGRRRQ
jgi:hypothetical protein